MIVLRTIASGQGNGNLECAVDVDLMLVVKGGENSAGRKKKILDLISISATTNKTPVRGIQVPVCCIIVVSRRQRVWMISMVSDNLQTDLLSLYRFSLSLLLSFLLLILLLPFRVSCTASARRDSLLSPTGAIQEPF